eukprot:m.65308 g.65308  ORF g.65308 m.65308 type:complete len:508 (+) comp8278_c0_seq2:105-1628(+)
MMTAFIYALIPRRHTPRCNGSMKTLLMVMLATHSAHAVCLYPPDEDGHVTIPDTDTSVPAFAFAGCTSLVSLNVSDSVTTINQGAFQGCNALSSVYLPTSVQTVGVGAFPSCLGFGLLMQSSSLNNPRGQVNCVPCTDTHLVVPPNVTHLGIYAFLACTNVMHVTLPESLVSIGESAFDSCINLMSLTVPPAVTTIGTDAFFMCGNLSHIDLPNSITHIGWYAFEYTDSLTTVVIPPSLTSLEQVFFKATGLRSIVIPAQVTDATEAFAYCDNLETVHLPVNMTSIFDRMFLMCSSLKNITIPNTVTSIGLSSFSGCESLSSIDLPASVVSVGSHAFKACTNLTEVTIADTVAVIGFEAFSGCGCPSGMFQAGVQLCQCSPCGTASTPYDGPTKDWYSTLPPHSGRGVLTTTVPQSPQVSHGVPMNLMGLKIVLVLVVVVAILLWGMVMHRTTSKYRRLTPHQRAAQSNAVFVEHDVITFTWDTASDVGALDRIDSDLYEDDALLAA